MFFQHQISILEIIVTLEVMMLKIPAKGIEMLGCFNPLLGKIWTNPAIGLKM